MTIKAVKHFDHKEFLQNLKMALDENAEARDAWQEARRGGCTDLNLITFLYAYSVGESLVLGPRREKRRRILAKLSALARKLESTATEAEQLLQLRWWKDQPVSELLSVLTVELEAEQASVIRDGRESLPISGIFKVKGTLQPNYLLELPQILRFSSQVLNMFNKGLGKERGWDERSVGKTLYLADLVLYWKGVSGESPAWKDVAAITESARIAAGSRGRFVDATTLRLNFENFKKRNPDMCSDFEQSLPEYLQSKPNMSFYAWYRQRQSKGTR